ncbi:MAG: hypothetical protein VKP57_07995 [Candidatus Sericytochromatia bacterium]|nr:hypothetical protein [Candidatus Sericytochromatia bacterium]
MHLNDHLVKNAIAYATHSFRLSCLLRMDGSSVSGGTCKVAPIVYHLPPEFFGEGKADISDLDAGVNLLLETHQHAGDFEVSIKRSWWRPGEQMPARACIERLRFRKGRGASYLAEPEGWVHVPSLGYAARWSAAGLRPMDTVPDSAEPVAEIAPWRL